MKLMVVTGEPSGDRLAAAMVRALRAKHGPLEVVGLGGERLAAEGLRSVAPLATVARMGVWEVVPKLPEIFGVYRDLVALAAREKPDVLLTVDSYELCSRVARRVAKLPGLGAMPRVHYNPPKVWAWRQGRVKTLARDFTHLMSILPFEGPWFAGAGVPCTYVGHPMMQDVAPLRLAPEAPRGLVLALLPGSRATEVRAHWAVMLATYRRLRVLVPALRALLVVPDERVVADCRALADWSTDEGVEVVSGEARFAALARCKVALAKSGTNTLELAVLGVPAVVGYVLNPVTFWLAKRLVRVPHVALPNLVLDFAGRGQGVYPEFVQQAFTVPNLTRALHPLLVSEAAWGHQVKLLAEVQRRMAVPVPPAEAAAEVVWAAAQK